MPKGGTQLGSGHHLVSALTNSSRNICISRSNFFRLFFFHTCPFVNLNILYYFLISINLFVLYKAFDCGILVPGDPKKYSCLINRKMHNKRGIFKIEILLNYQ